MLSQLTLPISNPVCIRLILKKSAYAKYPLYMTHSSPISCSIFTFKVVSRFFLLPDLTPFFDFPDRRAAFVTREKLSLFKVMHLYRRLELQLHTFCEVRHICPSVRLCVHMEQFGCHRTDFHEI